MNQPAPRVRALFGLLALCLGVCVLAGCYTTLRHPVTADLPNDYSYSEKSCYECHDEASFYHAQYGVYYNYYSDPWFGYYSDPWWYDTYWYDDHAQLPGASKPDDRRQWGRGIPSGAPRGGSGADSPYLREGYSNSSKPSEPSKKAEKPKEQKKTDESRRSYGRGKKK
jgi:hypothetical protein